MEYRVGNTNLLGRDSTDDAQNSDSRSKEAHLDLCGVCEGESRLPSQV